MGDIGRRLRRLEEWAMGLNCRVCARPHVDDMASLILLEREGAEHCRCSCCAWVAQLQAEASA